MKPEDAAEDVNKDRSCKRSLTIVNAHLQRTCPWFIFKCFYQKKKVLNNLEADISHYRELLQSSSVL